MEIGGIRRKESLLFICGGRHYNLKLGSEAMASDNEFLGKVAK